VGDDFGVVAVYLASDARTYRTGDTFVTDGGHVMFWRVVLDVSPWQA